MVTLGGIDAADFFVVISGVSGKFLGQGKIQLQDIGAEHSGIKTKIRVALFDKRVDACMAAAALLHYLPVQITGIGKLVEGLMGFGQCPGNKLVPAIGSGKILIKFLCSLMVSGAKQRLPF